MVTPEIKHVRLCKDDSREDNGLLHCNLYSLTALCSAVLGLAEAQVDTLIVRTWVCKLELTPADHKVVVQTLFCSHIINLQTDKVLRIF